LRSSSLARHQVAVLGGPLDGVAQRADAARDDRHLVHRVAARLRQRHQRVAHLVVGHGLALAAAEHAVALLQPGDDALDRHGEVGQRHLVGALRRVASQRRLVDQVGQVGAAETGGERGHLSSSRFPARQLDLAHVHLQDVGAAASVGPVDQHLAVEAAGAQQRRVEDFRPVGGARMIRPDEVSKPSISDQQLVQRLLLLVVPAHRAGEGAARAAQRIELVDEDDRRRLQRAPARTGRAPARHRRRRTSRRTRCREIEKNGTPASPATALASSVLPVPGGPTSSTPLGMCAPRRPYSLRMLQEIDDSCSSCLGLVDTGDVGEITPVSVSRRPWRGSCRST
jgi:hypothetical protein